MRLLDTERLRRGTAAQWTEMAAQLAETVASTFERLAGTYQRMADGTDSPDKAARLRGHVTRLNDRTHWERAEARRLRSLIEPSRVN